jgi:hypothetical protein
VTLIWSTSCARRTPIRYLAFAFPADLLDIYADVGVPAAQPRIPDGGVPPADVDAWLRLAPSFELQVFGPPLAVQPETDRTGGWAS